MKNKKAQTGNILATIPTLFLVIFIILIFVSLTALLTFNNQFIQIFTKSEEPSSIATKELGNLALIPQEKNNLLLKQIKVTLRDGAEKTLNVFEALHLVTQQKLRLIEFQEALPSLLNEKENCLYFKFEETPVIAYKDNIKLSIGELSIFQNKLAKTTLQNENRKLNIIHYIGRC